MKLRYVMEMAKASPSYEHLGMFLGKFEDQLRKGADHVGDIEGVKIYKGLDQGDVNYIASHDGVTVLGFFIITGRNILTTVYVVPEARMQSLLAMFIMFLFRAERMSEIQIGDDQSFAIISALQRLGTRFACTWVDKNTGGRVPYDPKTAIQFYAIDGKSSKWTLVLAEHPLSEGSSTLVSRYWHPGRLGTWYHSELAEGFNDPLEYQGQVLFGYQFFNPNHEEFTRPQQYIR
jgi:hypothetical protein